MLAVLLGVAITTLDVSLTSTALPAIAARIGAAPADTIWVVNVYYLSVVAALSPLAALGEIHGHRRIFLAGLGVFALGAIACSLSSSLPALMAGRAVVGLGSAAVSATTPALVRTIYPPRLLARGLGVYALVVGVAITAGPTVTSIILAIGDWRWLFIVSAPPALLACLLAARGLPDTDRNHRRFDTLSALLCAAAFGCLLFGIAGVGRLGPHWVVAAIIVGVTCGYALRRRESGQHAPIFAVDLFRIPAFSLSAATSICAFTVQGVAFVGLPFLFQSKMGYSQVEAGLLLTSWPAALVITTLVAPRLAERVAPAILGGAGLLVAAASLGSLALLPASAHSADIVVRLALSGVGFGFFQSPNMLALMRSAPVERSGGASGLLATSRLFGQSMGAATVAICLSLLAPNGLSTAIGLGAAIAIIGSGVSFSRLLPGARQGGP
jgi:DHA2 family multidrug resistance protein-like MFS transporter